MAQLTTPQPAVGEHPQAVYQKKKVIFRAYQIIWYILGLVETLLAFRVFFKLLGANPNSGFASFIYSMSEPLATPFYGLFKITRAEGSVFEWSTLIGMIVYAIIAYGVVKLMQIVKPTTPEEVTQKIDNQ